MKYYWSINKVPFYFFLFLYFIYTSFWEDHLKHTSIELQGFEVQMKYTYAILHI